MLAVVEWVMTAVVALAGGTFGGVILAPKISWRSEQGRRRYEAETATRKALETYRSTMAYRRREITTKQ